MDAPDMIITIDDVRRAGFCAGVKTRRWFVDHGFDFQRFLREGVSATEFLDKGDGLAERVVCARLAREISPEAIEGLIITADDAQDAGKCALGNRAFARRTGLDFANFLQSGIPAADLMATGDPEALEVVRHKLRG